MVEKTVLETIRHNCDISDARDNGIYSICALVLKLRNLYKWENSLEPWQEPESADLLAWIDRKEKFWQAMAEEPFAPLVLNGTEVEPFDQERINQGLGNAGLMYGAGYGRSLKSIFFLAEILKQELVEGCPVFLLGRESARELSSPFAMLRDGVIIIRRDPLRFFFWDQIQEHRAASRVAVRHALDHYGVLRDGVLDQERLRDRLDIIVDGEIPMFVHHEIGEMRQQTLDSATLRRVVAAFPDSAVEFVTRAVKDVLADTHPSGLVSSMVREQKEGSLGFYIGFLAGLRRVLFPEIGEAFDRFLEQRDWRLIEQARQECRSRMRDLAGKIRDLTERLDHEGAEHVLQQMHREVLVPLDLPIPALQGESAGPD